MAANEKYDHVVFQDFRNPTREAIPQAREFFFRLMSVLFAPVHARP